MTPQNRNTNGEADDREWEEDDRVPTRSRKRANYTTSRRYERKRASASPKCGINARRNRRMNW